MLLPFLACRWTQINFKLFVIFRLLEIRKRCNLFIGFCNFYGKFAEQHASKLSPLIELIKKDALRRFGLAESARFELVKSSLTNIYVSHPDFTRDSCLKMDASKLGFGGELFQYLLNEWKTLYYFIRQQNT